MKTKVIQIWKEENYIFFSDYMHLVYQFVSANDQVQQG